jgi:predicted permease
MDFIYSDNVRKLCLSCNVKNSKITVKLSEKKRNKRSSNRFLIVSFVKSARILLPFLIVAQHCVFLSNRCLCGLRFVYCSINFVYMECFVLCVKFQNFVYMLWVFVHCFLIFAFMDWVVLLHLLCIFISVLHFNMKSHKIRSKLQNKIGIH